jgi:hypothetical protein
MMKYGIFMSCTWNYAQYLNALLNSIEKRKLYQGDHEFDVHLLYSPDFPESYLQAIGEFPYIIVPVAMDRDTSIFGDEESLNRFAKVTRFEYMIKMADHYDVVCLLDADLMITSHEFMNLFDLISGTDKLIGCNERFKWTVCSDQFMYYLDDQPVFDEPTTLHKFMCSVPIIFDMKAWRPVFEYYLRLASEGYEVKDAERKPMGDMFSWNVSVKKNGRENDLILFPMETMTQVHYTNTDPFKRVINDNGYWHSRDGDPVYSLHGRIDTDSWEPEHWRIFEQNHGPEAQEKYRNGTRQSIEMVRSEWLDLNNNYIVKWREYGAQPIHKEELVEKTVNIKKANNKVRIYG